MIFYLLMELSRHFAEIKSDEGEGLTVNEPPLKQGRRPFKSLIHGRLCPYPRHLKVYGCIPTHLL